MGRPKLPSKKKIIQGTFRPCRENPDEPVPENPLGDAPDCLNAKQKKTWIELSGIALPGVLGDSDRIIVEITARLLTELRSTEGLSVGKMSHLINCLARLGLTPSDRSKIFGGGKKKKDPWGKFGAK